jgi:hypothetical protein
VRFFATQVQLNTRIVVDHSEDGMFQLNFKLTLPELSCEWAAIDSVDIVGNRRRHDLSNSAIYKCVRQQQCVVPHHGR